MNVFGQHHLSPISTDSELVSFVGSDSSDLINDRRFLIAIQIIYQDLSLVPRLHRVCEAWGQGYQDHTHDAITHISSRFNTFPQRTETLQTLKTKYVELLNFVFCVHPLLFLQVHMYMNCIVICDVLHVPASHVQFLCLLNLYVY